MNPIDFIHRRLWQKLPRGPRRALLLQASKLIAPRPSFHPVRNGSVIVAGFLRTASGLGQSARLCYEAFRSQGADVFAVDLSKALRQPVDLPDYSYRDGSRVLGPATLILHVNSPYVPLALAKLGQSFVSRKYIIGYWAWELPEAPPEWNIGSTFVHDILVPSHFTATALAKLTSKQVNALPHPVATFPFRPRASTPRRDPTILICFDMGSSFARKNPIAAITATRRVIETSSHVRLMVKVMRPGTFARGQRALETALEGMSNARVIDRVLSASDMQQVYADADLVVTLHRSEGFGLIAAEAMLAGLPVVTTNWSATSEFITEERGMPVDYTLVPARDPQGDYNHPDLSWAEAKIDDAVAKIRILMENEKRLEIGQNAREFALERFSPERYVSDFYRLLSSGASTSLK